MADASEARKVRAVDENDGSGHEDPRECHLLRA